MSEVVDIKPARTLEDIEKEFNTEAASIGWLVLRSQIDQQTIQQKTQKLSELNQEASKLKEVKSGS